MSELVDSTIALIPVVLLAVTALAVFTVDAILPDRNTSGLLAGISAIGAIGALVTSLWYLYDGIPSVNGSDPSDGILASQLVVDDIGLIFTAIVSIVTLLVVLGGYDYLKQVPRKSEFYSLVLLAATGMATLAFANSLPTAFIAFELASLPSYVLVAYHKDRQGSAEAGFKYFVIGAISSAVLLYGISLVYASTGALVFSDILSALPAEGADKMGLFGIGVLMMIVGLGFKVAAVPFHFWAPEAYDAAPAPVGAFLSSASKAAGFVITFRIFFEAFPMSELPATEIDWILIFGALAVLTMLLGNYAALVQSNVKRMLAYSSIGHAGYVLIVLGALSTSNFSGAENQFLIAAGILHLTVYAFMNTGAFLFASVGEYWNLGQKFSDFAGLAKEAPILCVAMTILLFNLAGLPIGGGFWSKYLLFTGAIQTEFWWLAAVGALTSAVSLYYYTRLVKVMWIDEPDQPHGISSRPTGIYVSVLTAATVSIALLVVWIISGVDAVEFDLFHDLFVDAANNLLPEE